MSRWHADLKRSSTLPAYFAGIADPVPQNIAANFSIIERLLFASSVFENTPALPVLVSSLETVVPSRLRARPPQDAGLRPNNSKDSVHGPYS